MDDNDDVAEKARNRQRKKEALAARSAASPFKSPSAKKAGKAPANAKRKLTDQGMADLYTNCIKLSADNVRAAVAVPLSPAATALLLTSVNRALHTRAENQPEKHMEP
jgi:hypothetical protein